MTFGELKPGDKFIFPFEDPQAKGGACDVLIKMDDTYTYSWTDFKGHHEYKTNVIHERTGTLLFNPVAHDHPVLFLSMESRPR